MSYTGINKEWLEEHDKQVRAEGAKAEREKLTNNLIAWLSDPEVFCDVDDPHCISFTCGLSDSKIMIKKIESLREGGEP